MAVSCIRLENVIKTYDRQIVLDVESCSLACGNVYGLVGTNGVGKTTLLEILYGSVAPDHGKVDLGGMKVEMVHHSSGLFQEMTVFENMYLGREAYHRRLGFKSIDWKKVKADTREVLEKYGLVLDVEARVHNLQPSMQKLLEVVIALSREPDVIIIDEPLIYLDLNQIGYLNGLIKSYVSAEKIGIYASHRLDSLFSVVDEVITMRDGKIVAVQRADDKVLQGLLEFAERDIHKYPKREVKKGKVLLEVDNLCAESIEGINFDLYEGEIIGIIGLKDANKSNIGKALFGAIPASGRIRVDGSVKRIKSTTQAVESGICYIGSANEGMFLDDSVIENVVSANVPRARKLSRGAKRLISKYYLEMLNIMDEKADASFGSMSAGNKQKVLLAKWFFSKSKIFIFNKPTANIDVASKVDIYNIFSDLAESGAGIVIISNDLEEVAGICDRVLVIRDGEISHELARSDLSVHYMVSLLQNWS